MPDISNVSPSVSVSPYRISEVPSVTVVVVPSVAVFVSLSATGLSFVAVTLIVIV